MTAQMPQELLEVLDRCVQDTTSRYAGIALQRGTVSLSEDICTVHTVLEGTQRTAVLLCADTALMARLARGVLRQEQVTAQDVEDVAKEYFNVICGQITAGLFRLAHISSRFQVPRFRTGPYQPEGLPPNRYALHYSGGDNENAQLIFLHLPSQEPKA